jgi:membrane protease YdiL (CAAX protease family)
VGVVVFAMLNGALEELVYRGVLLSALDAALGASALSLALQAIAFGAMHIHGFPSGAAGVGLASIYGLMLGLVRRQARGMLGPWLAHVLADVTIGAILVATR